MRKMFNDREKYCSRCKKWLPLENFTIQSNEPSGRSNYCRVHQREYYRKYNTTEKRKKWMLNHRYGKYGLTEEKYNELLKKQDGKCAVCGKEEKFMSKGHIKKLAVDHDHLTGKVRGLLCLHCNLILGLLKDDLSLIPKFEKYLWPNIA